MTTLTPAPLKRLSRPAEPPSFRITERDLAILRAVARYRFLSSTQIACIVGGSPQALLVRLKKLFYHGFLDRPRHQHAQLALFFDEGNHPLVYGLGRAGARLLSERDIDINADLDWTTKNARATATFLAHTLETADVMIALQKSAHDRNIGLTDHHDLIASFPAATRAKRDPFRFRVTVRVGNQQHTIAVIPDRVFSLVYDDDTRHNAVLELDRGTIDIKAKRISGKSSIRRKQIAYFEAWKQRRHTEAWNFKSFRVLTVTPSDTRMANMAATQDEVTGGKAPGLFLYTTPPRLESDGPFDCWIDGNGERVGLA